MENRSIIQSNFIIANRDLINKFGVNSAILLGELYGRYNYFKKRNQLKNGFFFATKNSIESSTKLTPYKQRTASSILENANILEVKYIDIPPKTYYKNLTHHRNQRLWVGTPEPCCIYNNNIKKHFSQ